MPEAEAGLRAVARSEEGFFARRPEVLLVFVTFAWGSTFIVTKDVVRSVPPIAYVLLRFALATGLLGLLFPRAFRARGAARRDGAVLGLLQASGLLLQVFGQVYTTASKASFVTSLSTVATPFLAFALHGARPSRAQGTGAALATLGLCLLTLPSDVAELGARAFNRGDLLSLASALIYALVIVETAARARHHDVGTLTTLQTATGLGFFACAYLVSHVLLAVLPPQTLPHLLALEARPLSLSTQALGQIVYMGVVCTVLTFLAQTYAMRRMSATHSAVVFALEPVFATGLAIAVEGSAEWPGSRAAVGALFILGGVVASEVAVSRTRRRRGRSWR